MGNTITREALARMYPHALPQWLDALEKLAPPLLAYYGFNRLDWCGMAGQIDAETDGLSLASMQEDMRFTASRMLEVYSKRLGDCVGVPVPPLGGRVFASKAALARALEHKPKETADVVYGGPRGREGTPPWCGSRYIGRGPLQETHLDNYRAARDEIRRQPGGAACPDLVDCPEELASNPELGVRNIFGQWKSKGLSKYAHRSDWQNLSSTLNTGAPGRTANGLARRLRATARALAIWPADAWEEPSNIHKLNTANASPLPGPREAEEGPRALRQGDDGEEVKRLQERLAELGFATGPADGNFGVLTTRALVAFQAEHKLKPDGIAGPRTLEVLAASAPAPGPHNDLTAADLTGSSTIQAITWAKRGVQTLLGGKAALEADDQLGLGLVDGIVSKGEQAQSLLGRIAALGLPLPSARFVGFLVVAAICGGLLILLNRAEFGRVKAARKGG